MKYLIVKKKYLKNSYEDSFEVFIKGYKHAYTRYKDYTSADIYLTSVYVKDNNKHTIKEIKKYVNSKDLLISNKYSLIRFFKYLKANLEYNYKYGKTKNKIVTTILVVFKYIKFNLLRKIDKLVYNIELNFLKLKVKLFKNNTYPLPPNKDIIESIDSFVESNEDKKEKLLAHSVGIYTNYI